MVQLEHSRLENNQKVRKSLPQIFHWETPISENSLKYISNKKTHKEAEMPRINNHAIGVTRKYNNLQSRRNRHRIPKQIPRHRLHNSSRIHQTKSYATDTRHRQHSYPVPLTKKPRRQKKPDKERNQTFHTLTVTSDDPLRSRRPPAVYIELSGSR